jgi:hypothetical protein
MSNACAGRRSAQDGREKKLARHLGAGPRREFSTAHGRNPRVAGRFTVRRVSEDDCRAFAAYSHRRGKSSYRCS